MKLNSKLLIAMSAGIIQLGVTGTSYAQEVIDLDNVVISATKNDQKQSQTGKVVTIIGRDVLDRSQGKNLVELLNEQAGLVVGGASANAGLNKSLFLRGAGSAYAVVLIDGILVSNPAGAGSAFDLRMFSIDQIDHIEILKGGQSTIYGSDAVSGVVNIVTKKGKDAGNSVYGVASYGTYNTYKGTIGMSANVDKFSYNIAYTQGKTDGFSEAAEPAGNTTPFEKDGNNTGAVNANFSLQATDHFSISPFLRYFYGHYDFDATAFSDNPTNNSKVKHFNGGVSSRYNFGTGKITFNYSYETSSLGSVNQYGSNLGEGKLNLIDLFYNQKVNSNVDVLVGLDNRATSSRTNSGPSVSTNLFSTYASVFAHDLSIFNLEIGGRYNKHRQYGENYTYNITPSINIIKQVKLFGTLSTSFKTPTLENLFGLYGANLNLKPESSKNYEAGINFSLADNKYTLRVAGFKRDLTDGIVYGNVGYVNQAHQTAKGFELEPSLKFGAFHFNGFYAYVEGTEFNFVTNEVSDYLLRRPKHIFGLNAGIQATSKFYLSSSFKYNGKRTDGNFDDYVIENLPAYKLLNFYGEYTLLKKIKLFADFKNVLNEKYNEFYGYNNMGFNVNAGVSFTIK